MKLRTSFEEGNLTPKVSDFNNIGHHPVFPYYPKLKVFNPYLCKYCNYL